MSNVKLAVRVRPFTEKELKSEKDKIPVVTILDENIVTITNVKVSTSGAGDSRERVRRYFADFTFDSACSPSLQNYASQEKVYESIGREVLSCLSRGSSACVLAYGQSATGKTHTMMGTETQPGLVPRLCRAIAEDAGFEVTVSFLEIYNERVHDLLAGEDAPATCHSLPRRRGNARKDLRVREHPSRGPYVQNLRRVSVRSVEALLSLVNEGARRRRTAATRRNSTSSRSHALLELVTRRATLHLADLAGSEKASWEGCGGGRQKEGANINKSLVALSNVISALVNSRGGRGRFVPYRDSALTWLLKDCFTGGASTFIIATVSPSVACYGESASTLRWAARARQLPTQRVVHLSLNNATRAALQAQFNQLLAELARHHIRYIHETGNIAYDDKHWTLEMKKSDAQRQDNPNSISRNIMNANNLRGNAKSTSTSSSVASGSSEIIYTMDTNANPEVNQEVEDLFGPALERTRSGIDLKTTVSLKDKRQYRSQEVLPIDKISVARQNNISDLFQKRTVLLPEKNNVSNTAPVTVIFDNQRAEIVASVTERLYSKMKKKEEAAVSKIESVVDRKIVEPLSELKICSNARQRLMDLSQKAMRHKRRIGIPAHTQTRKSVVRMRETGTDIQSDLEPYVIKDRDMYTLYRDVGTETMITTPRLREKAVGPCGSLDFRDKCTATKSVICVNSVVMTDIVTKSNRYTQTPIVSPPRRKRRASLFKDYKRSFNDYDVRDASPEDFNVSPVISINISQSYVGDSDSQSSDTSPINVVNESTPTMMMTPDLLTNHGNMDSINEKNENTNQIAQNVQEDTTPVFQKDYEDFSDSDDSLLPKVTANTSRKKDHQEIKRLILGRNENTYPYNIVISPFKERDQSEKLVKFKGYDTAPPSFKSVQVDSENGNNQDKKSIKDLSSDGGSLEAYSNRYKNSQGSTCSDSVASSKSDTDSFIWKKGGIIYKPNNGDCYRCQKPTYNSKYKSTKRRIYKEFLGLDCNEVQCSNCSETSNNVSSSDCTEVSQSSLDRFRQRRRFFENQNYCNGIDKYDTLEKKILHSCHRLEAAVTNYEDRSLDHLNNRVSLTTPKKYLQHLVQLRREVIKANSDSP